MVFSSRLIRCCCLFIATVNYIAKFTAVEKPFNYMYMEKTMCLITFVLLRIIKYDCDYLATNIIRFLVIKIDITLTTYQSAGGLMLLVQDLALCEEAEQTTIQPHHDDTDHCLHPGN